MYNAYSTISTGDTMSSSGTLTNVVPHRNGTPQTQDMTPHPVTVYRHNADLSVCYPLTWNVTLEYTTTHSNVLGQTRSGNHSPIFHTYQRALNFYAGVVVVNQKIGRKCSVHTRSKVIFLPLSCF